MIHPYLRAAGFSDYRDRKKINALLSKVVNEADIAKEIQRDDGRRTAFFKKEFSLNTGLAVFGEYDDKNGFILEYYFPYVNGTVISTTEELSVQSTTMQDALEGIVDDVRVGVSLIFFVNNMSECIEKTKENADAIKKANLSLSALADEGTVLFPIAKSKTDKELTRKKTQNRLHMISQAKSGNESAIENLTLEDMDLYTAVSRKIKNNDVFTLVDSYFIPDGVECDHYSLLGEIVSCEKTANSETKEKLFLMKVLCNDILFDICINAGDLEGEPEIGRRFKGNVWMQGRVNFT